MPNVPNELKNMIRCQCPVCPVQAGSNCINQKRPEWDSIISNIDYQKSVDAANLEAQPELNNKDMIGVYCAIGLSGCGNLDGTQNCLCPTCAVWQEYGLTSLYFCLQGSAIEVE